eukprot:g28477.t1
MEAQLWYGALTFTSTRPGVNSLTPPPTAPLIMAPPLTTKTSSPKPSTTSSPQVNFHPQHPTSSFHNPALPVPISFPNFTILTVRADPLSRSAPAPLSLVPLALSLFSPLVQQPPTGTPPTPSSSSKSSNSLALIFIMDIKSLYTCIPHTDNLKSLCFFLSRRPKQPPSTDTLICLTELVLTLNNFSFNSSHFLQTKGMPMGPPMGPSYACLFVRYMEQSHFRCYTGTIPYLFHHYIDDCIGAAFCSHEELEQFMNFTNIFLLNLKFTL